MPRLADIISGSAAASLAMAAARQTQQTRRETSGLDNDTTAPREGQVAVASPSGMAFIATF